MYTKNKNNQQNKVKWPAIIGAVIVAAIVVGLVWALLIRGNPKDSNSNTSNVNAPGSTKLDLTPATESDQQYSNDRKEQAATNSPPPSSENTNLKNVAPVIVDASQYGATVEVRAFVPGIYEDGGTCAITFTRGSAVIQKTLTAKKNATNTSCSNLSMPTSDFSDSGTWSVLVSYSSGTAKGVSETKSLEIKR